MKPVLSLKENKISWTKYAVDRYIWSSFRVVLNIDNFNNTHSDYISVSLKAISSDPEDSWEASNFAFEQPEKPHESDPNLPFEIGQGKIVDVQVFISDLDIGHSERRPMPSFDRDRLVLLIKTKSGARFTIPIKPGWIMLG